MKNKVNAFIVAALLGSTSTALASDAIITRTGNLRAGPGTGYITQGAIPAGGHVNVHLCRKNWCQVSYLGHKGWMAMSLLAFNDNYRPGRSRSQVNIIISDDSLFPFWRPHYRPWHPHFHRPPPPFPPPPPPPPRPYPPTPRPNPTPPPPPDPIPWNNTPLPDNQQSDGVPEPGQNTMQKN